LPFLPLATDVGSARYESKGRRWMESNSFDARARPLAEFLERCAKLFVVAAAVGSELAKAAKSVVFRCPNGHIVVFPWNRAGTRAKCPQCPKRSKTLVVFDMADKLSAFRVLQAKRRSLRLIVEPLQSHLEVIDRRAANLANSRTLDAVCAILKEVESMMTPYLRPTGPGQRAIDGLYKVAARLIKIRGRGLRAVNSALRIHAEPLLPWPEKRSRTQFVFSPLQQAIYNALSGRALKKQSLANEACGGDGGRLYKPGGIKELIAAGKVQHKHGVGYYRPDAPPQPA
jgi:hypothetical protein